jgi:hypothetical protein
MDWLYLRTAQLHVQSYYLFSSSEEENVVELTGLFDTACSFIADVAQLEDISGLASHCPYYIFSMLIASACSILKLSRSPRLQHLDKQTGTSSYFSVIALCKKISIENNDTPGRSAGILSQLWTASAIFTRSDGENWWQLRVRTRLNMSIVFDYLRWYRELFGGQSNAYPQQSADKATSSTTTWPGSGLDCSFYAANGVNNSDQRDGDDQMASGYVIDDQGFPELADLDWATIMAFPNCCEEQFQCPVVS